MDEKASRRPKFADRKSSFSDTLSKFASNTFTRRRTTTEFSTTSASIPSTTTKPQHFQSRLPTPSKLPRSSSFFSSLNAFVPRVTPSHTYSKILEPESTEVKATKKSRDFSYRLSQPTSFFHSASANKEAEEPLLPSQKRRDSTTQITQRGLMQPITNPPLPRRSTTNNLNQKPVGQTPSFMRPTSSSAARHTITRAAGKINNAFSQPASKTATPSNVRARPSGRRPSGRNLSLPAASGAFTEIPEEDNQFIDSPNLGLEMAADNSRVVSPSQILHEEIGPCGAELDASVKPAEPGLMSQPVQEEEEEEMEDHVSEEEEPVLTLNPHLVRSSPPLPPLSYLAPQTKSQTSQINTAQPTSYWLGRLTALSDRFRTEALLGAPTPAEAASSPMQDDACRMRRVFLHLHVLCATKEARKSLEQFWEMWAEREAGIGSGGGKGGKKVKEKRGVFETLMGRKK